MFKKLEVIESKLYNDQQMELKYAKDIIQKLTNEINELKTKKNEPIESKINVKSCSCNCSKNVTIASNTFTKPEPSNSKILASNSLNNFIKQPVNNRLNKQLANQVVKSSFEQKSILGNYSPLTKCPPLMSIKTSFQPDISNESIYSNPELERRCQIVYASLVKNPYLKNYEFIRIVKSNYF